MKKVIYVLLLVANTYSFAWATAFQITFDNSGIPLPILEKTITAMKAPARTVRYVQIMATSNTPPWSQSSICIENKSV